MFLCECVLDEKLTFSWCQFLKQIFHVMFLNVKFYF